MARTLGAVDNEELSQGELHPRRQCLYLRLQLSILVPGMVSQLIRKIRDQDGSEHGLEGTLRRYDTGGHSSVY